MTLEKSVNDFAVEEHLTESERIALITYVRRLRADGYRVVKLREAPEEGYGFPPVYEIAEELT